MHVAKAVNAIDFDSGRVALGIVNTGRQAAPKVQRLKAYENVTGKVAPNMLTSNLTPHDQQPWTYTINFISVSVVGCLHVKQQK